MHFELTDGQQLIREAVREFAEAEVAPIAAELDRDHRFPYELLPRLVGMNLMGMPYPERWVVRERISSRITPSFAAAHQASVASHRPSIPDTSSSTAPSHRRAGPDAWSRIRVSAAPEKALCSGPSVANPSAS